MGLRGGGKRGASTVGRGRKADVSKEEVLAEMTLTLQRNLQSLVSCQTPALIATLNHISQLKSSCEANDMYGMDLVAAFNNVQLQNLNFAAGSGNKDYKVSMVRSFVFLNDLKALAMVESEINLVKEIMSDICRRVLTSSFSNEKGEIGWAEIQDHIIKIMHQRGLNEGAARAKAKAHAKSAAGDAPEDNDVNM